MIKKIVLLAALLVTFGCGEQATTEGSGKPVASQQVFKWKLVTTWPKNFPGLGEAPENFAKLVEEMSSGRLKIKVYGAGQLVPALEVFDAVSQGTAEMGHSASYYWAGKIKAAPLFSTVPFGFNAQEMNSWLHHGGGMDLWRELYAPFDLVPFAGGNTGVQMAGWFNKEINSLEDLQGLIMRIPGLGGEVFTRAGGEAVNIPGGELYTAMQTGVIDATEWVAPFNDLAFGLHQVAKHYYYPGWHEPGTSLEFIVNSKDYETLPADLKKIIEVATRTINQDLMDQYTARNNSALEQLIGEHGVQVHRLPDDVLKQLAKITEQVMEERAAGDPFFKKVYTSQQNFRKHVSAYLKITEEAYFTARQSVR